ncbi:hypothetical protein J4G33_06500 [Actinotalea sp. BY-33]|uniref:Uncharacterized protein n=1 Tax=Actinotalea soli TaxID=2819234 RepID=A0A939RVS7_9CELL|nr:hypothetical protein [Actinotalea soli]MBO1751451.1 hypothetical protein [Actinotalea soli]
MTAPPRSRGELRPSRPRLRTVTAAAAALTATLALTACESLDPAAPDNPPQTLYAAPADQLGGIEPCAGVTSLTADPALYADEPSYGNATDLVEEVHAWADEQDAFVELWLDRERHGWVHVGVEEDAADVESLQAEVADRFPGEGVVVVPVPYTLAELTTVADDVMAALDDGGVEWAGVAPSPHLGVVVLDGVVDSPEAREALTPFADQPVCADPVPAEDVVPDGEQPPEGEGWRLLGHAEGAGEPYRTGVATTEEQLVKLWGKSGLTPPAPPVDWEQEVVVWFGAVWGSGCPVRLDGIVTTGSTLHGEIVTPGAPGACNADANPHAFVVAVERSALPAGPFQVQLTAQDPPEGAPEERTMVDVDLTEPGSTATDEQIHTDPEAGPQLGALIEDGHPQLPENGDRYAWHDRPECEGVVIGPIDGTLWRLADGEAEWTEAEGQELIVHPVDTETLVLASASMDYLFVRATDGVCAD